HDVHWRGTGHQRAVGTSRRMTAPPVTPVDAATVVLTRQTDDGWECFMVRRHIKSDFAADVFVFPGGKVDDADRTLAAALGTGSGEPEPALYVAAIRELFEEAGVLLAGRGEDRWVELQSDEA